MSDVNALLQTGSKYRQRGEHERAVEIYRAATQLPDAPGEAFFNLGNALQSLERWAEAITAFTECLARKPDLHSAHLQLARCEVARGELAKARDHFAAILLAEPRNFSAWLEAGNIARRQGISAQALAAYSKAAEVAPARWEGHFALARALEEAGQPEYGAQAYHRAVAAAGSADAEQHRTRTPPASNGHAPLPEGKPANRLRSVHWAMAKARLERGDVAIALEAMRQALTASRIEAILDQPVEPNEMAEMQIDLGEMLIRLGLEDDASRAFERASRATRETTLARLAEVSFRFNLWQEAQEVLRRNVELHPDSATAHWNLAHICAESWQLEEALASLARAEELGTQPGARFMRASVAGWMGDADTAMQLRRQLAEEEGPHSKMRSSAAMSALYSDTLSAQEVAALHRELFAPLGQGARAASSFRNTRDRGRPLRIGMVAADFHRQHPVNIFMQPILARLDHTAFEVTVYFVGVSYDEQTRIARGRVAHWVEATKWSDTQLAQRIEKDRIDVLLDLSGHTANNRMSLFGQRAAPVQATFLGYPCSTGVPNIDWIVADGIVAPPEHADLYSERVARLPGTVFCFAPEADYPLPTFGPEALARPITFGSFNNAQKLTPRTVRLWSRILLAVPESRLLLKAPSFKDAKACDAFAARFAAEGIARERLEFRGPVGLADMMAEYGDVDIGLDPVPYNGGTTTLQAMWMGVPVIVREGSHFVSRMGASFMGAAGFEDWIAADDEAYVAIAARMAEDRSALLDLKNNLRGRLRTRPAWDIDLYAQNFGAALRAMWYNFCEAHQRQ